MNALGVQVGGDHYARLGMQPVEFIARNKWDFFAGSILKYLTRWRDKGGLSDLEKALHFAHLRIELEGEIPPPFDGRMILMWEYLDRNAIPKEEHDIFNDLQLWIMAGKKGTEIRARFIARLEAFIETVRGVQPKLL